MMSCSRLALSTLAALLTALPALAQSQASFQRPGDAVEYRQSGFVIMETHLKRINAMAQGKVPFDAKAVADNAAIISTVAHLPFTAFPEGSDKVQGSHAKPEIWTEAAKFKEAADKLQAEVGKLDAAAKSGNQEQIKTAAAAVAQSCKSCHESFKAKGH